MNIYIFERIDHASSNYHEEGGLVLVAADLDDAKALVTEYEDEGVSVSEAEWQEATVLPLAGEVERSLTNFPDSGCC